MSGGSSSSPNSTGGGNSVYSSVQGNFTATSDTGAKTITLPAHASAVLSTLNFHNGQDGCISPGRDMTQDEIAWLVASSLIGILAIDLLCASKGPAPASDLSNTF